MNIQNQILHPTARILRTRTLFIIIAVTLSTVSANSAISAGTLTLAENNKTACVIALPDKPTASESFAAGELAAYLKGVTKAVFPVVNEKSVKDTAVYVGLTAYAQSQKIPVSSLAAEEWCIQTSGSNLIITGGLPRGTLYGVYEFLEKFCGVAWLSPDCEVIPPKSSLTISNLNIKAKPAYLSRYIASAWYRQLPSAEKYNQYILYVTRNKGNTLATNAAWGFSAKYGSPGAVHSFGYYVSAKELFPAHPEYFSMNPDGTRDGKFMVDDYASYQLCLTGKGLRQYLYERLKGYIQKDREDCTKSGAPFPTVYAFSQNDLATYICNCPDCKKISKEEGSESALVIDAVNFLSDKIKNEYPEISLQTMAYTCTEKPPKKIRPRSNIIIQLADIYAASDTCRPLSSPANREQAELIKAWSAITAQLGIWDYWKTFDGKTFPYINARAITEDLKFFFDNKVRYMFAECEDFTGRESFNNDLQSFYSFKLWAGHKAMQDPGQPFDDLCNIFFSGYYREAAAIMKEFHLFLEKSVEADSDKFLSPRQFRKYLTPRFFKDAYGIINKAVALCSSDETRVRVIRERMVLNAALYDNWDGVERIARQTKEKNEWTRKGLAAQYRDDWMSYLDSGVYDSVFAAAVRSAVSAESEMFAMALPLPEPFAALPPEKVLDLTWPKFQSGRAKITPDPVAAGGKSLRLESPDTTQRNNFQAGLYDSRNKLQGPVLEMAMSELPKDGKFHIIKIGAFPVKPGTKLWFPWTWYVQLPLDSAFDPLVPEQEWFVYASLRFSGTPFEPESKVTQAISIDRVILVKAGARRSGEDNQDTENLIKNGSFESGATSPDNWRLFCSAGDDFTYPEDGGSRGNSYLSFGPSAKIRMMKQDELKIEQGERYRLTLYVKGKNFTGGYKIGVMDSGLSKNIGVFNGAAFNSDEWIEKSVDFTAEEASNGKYSLVIQIYGGTSGDFMTDDIRLVKGE